MKKLAEVEDAKALMKEAMEWSMFKWLWEKSRVRRVADEANVALDNLNRTTKRKWSEEAKQAYRHLEAEKDHPKRNGKQQASNAPGAGGDAELVARLRRVKDADEKAHAARMQAEETFDNAEKQLSTGMAVEGCRQAIHSWNLHEKALREAEGLVEVSAKTK